MQAGGKQIIVRQATTPQLATPATATVGQPAVQLQAAQPQQAPQQQVVVAATPQQAAAVALQQQHQQVTAAAVAGKQPVMQTIQLQGGQRLSLIQTPGKICLGVCVSRDNSIRHRCKYGIDPDPNFCAFHAAFKHSYRIWYKKGLLQTFMQL